MTPLSKSDPNPDRVALMRAGQVVRNRLSADPTVERLTTDRAEIYAVRDFMNAQECARMMAMIDTTAKPSSLFDQDYIEAYRTSYSGNVERWDPFVRMIERRIDDLLGFKNAFGETVQGQRYMPGQEFKQHYDWFPTAAPYWKDEYRRGGQRCWTAMIYLNAVDEGGETVFGNIGISVPPQPGLLLTWNNATPKGEPSKEVLHAGTPVIKGTKYVITKWYRTRKWG